MGSFWPRWYHPLAAPTYSPIAVPDLAALIRHHAAKGKVVVAAHSQGAIITMAALLTIEAGDPLWRRVALLTYGNPVSQLYENVFPGQFNETTIEELRTRLTPLPEDDVEGVPRWFNLWRNTDPIGGPIDELDDRSIDIGVCLADGHSGYELTEPFLDSRDKLMSELAALP